MAKILGLLAVVLIRQAATFSPSLVAGRTATAAGRDHGVPLFSSPLNDNNSNNNADDVPFNVWLNEFFRKPVPEAIRERLDIFEDPGFAPRTDFDAVSLLTAPPGSPGVPRPLWLTIVGSVPTGLLWYGYYKFCVEEELFQMEMNRGITPKGFGGYGTLGPFVYGCLLGPIAFIFHLPGGMLWTNVGIAFIYYTQFLLYVRVNELYAEQRRPEPLTVWWCLPIFFPFDLIVGLRQVHFLSQYHYQSRGLPVPPTDPVVKIFPFIGKDTLTWPEFVLTPSLWFSFLEKVQPVDRGSLPEPLQQLFEWGEGKRTVSISLTESKESNELYKIK